MEELRLKQLTKETPVWYEGLSDWTKMECIAELKALLETMPPRLVGQRPAPTLTGSTTALQQSTAGAASDREARILSRVLQAVGIIGTAMLILSAISNHAG